MLLYIIYRKDISDMMTTKQRAFLKGIAMTTEPIFQIGKSSLTPELTEALNEALNKRELIKLPIPRLFRLSARRLFSTSRHLIRRTAR